MGQIPGLGRRESAQGPTVSHRTPIDQHVRRVGSTCFQLSRGLPKPRGRRHLNVGELNAWGVGCVGDDAILHALEINVASGSLHSPNAGCRKVGRIGQIDPHETREREEVVHHQSVHLVDHQRGAVIQHPGVDGSRIRRVLHLVPKHPIVQVVQYHEVVGVVDVDADVERSDVRMSFGG